MSADQGEAGTVTAIEESGFDFDRYPGWDAAVLNATFAASYVDLPAGFAIDDDTVQDAAVRDCMMAAAAFLRQWPDATAEAIAIHLRRSGFADVPEPDQRALAAWKVFAFTLSVLDDLDKPEASPPPEPAPPWPGERALKAEPGPFDPAGLSPRS